MVEVVWEESVDAEALGTTEVAARAAVHPVVPVDPLALEVTSGLGPDPLVEVLLGTGLV